MASGTWGKFGPAAGHRGKTRCEYTLSALVQPRLHNENAPMPLTSRRVDAVLNSKPSKHGKSSKTIVFTMVFNDFHHFRLLRF